MTTSTSSLVWHGAPAGALSFEHAITAAVLAVFSVQAAVRVRGTAEVLVGRTLGGIGDRVLGIMGGAAPCASKCW